MKILMIVPYYAPDLGPSAPLFTMLSTELLKLGHEVTVVAAVPHYPTGQVPVSFQGEWIQKTMENRVEVIRIRIPSLKRSNLSGRVLQFICYQLGATWACLSRNFDTVFVANPALWTWLPFFWMVVIRHKRAVFSIHDVYPDVGIQLGIFRHKWVIAVVAALERFCLSHSQTVRILSESFRPGVHRLGVPDSKIALIYDWVDTDLIQPSSKENDFSRENNLSQYFLVLYAGNIGLSQGLEHVLTAAEQLVSCEDVQFLFVGDGAGRERLFAEVKERQITNVRFLPFQPREHLPEVLASADVSLVILKKEIGFGSLPSKTFSILASGRPIIASVDQECETWNLIQQAGAGLCVPPEKPMELVNAILAIREDSHLREHMGCNGRKWALEHHSPRAAAEEIEHLLSISSQSA